MRNKILIVSISFWIFCSAFGWVWSQSEVHLNPRSSSEREDEIHKIADLYAAGLYEEVLIKCRVISNDSNYQPYEAQISYIRWATCRQIGRKEEAGYIQQDFLRRFSNTLLAAEIHFTNAVDLIGSGEYIDAEIELKIIQNDYANTAVAIKASTLLNQLCGGKTSILAR